jgi:hypothetical protein
LKIRFLSSPDFFINPLGLLYAGKSMHLNELKALHVSEVLKQAEALEIENTGRMRKQELMFAIIKKACACWRTSVLLMVSWKFCPMASASCAARHQLHGQYRRHLHQPQPSAPI